MLLATAGRPLGVGPLEHGMLVLGLVSEPLVVGDPSGLGSHHLEHVKDDERVHSAHGLVRHVSVWVYLLQHLVDVDGVGLLLRLHPPLLPSA